MTGGVLADFWDFCTNMNKATQTPAPSYGDSLTGTAKMPLAQKLDGRIDLYNETLTVFLLIDGR
jgi:hypothetical protein